MDLFEIAQENIAALERRAAELQASCRGDAPLAAAMAAFVDHIRAQGRISINMRPWVLSRFLSRGHYQNIYDWATEMAALSGRPPDILLAEKLGSYLAARRTFDGAFADGLCFRYGALNIGGTGPTLYGQFCIVARSEYPDDGRGTVYLAGDSLDRYVEPGNELREDLIRQDATPGSHCHCLALLKHYPQLDRPADAWPSLLCSDGDYLEAIFVAPFAPAQVQEVRVSANDQRTLWDLAFDSFSRKLDPGERALGQDFVDILTLLPEHARNLVEV